MAIKLEDYLKPKKALGSMDTDPLKQSQSMAAPKIGGMEGFDTGLKQPRASTGRSGGGFGSNASLASNGNMVGLTETPEISGLSAPAPKNLAPKPQRSQDDILNFYKTGSFSKPTENTAINSYLTPSAPAESTIEPEINSAILQYLKPAATTTALSDNPILNAYATGIVTPEASTALSAAQSATPETATGLSTESILEGYATSDFDAWKLQNGYGKTYDSEDIQMQYDSNLLGYYNQEKLLNEQLQGQQDKLAQQQSERQRAAYLQTQKLLRQYLPNYLNNAGLSGHGLSQSVYTDANNQYLTQRSDIASDIGNQNASIFDAYLAQKSNLSNQWQDTDNSIWNAYLTDKDQQYEREQAEKQKDYQKLQERDGELKSELYEIFEAAKTSQEAREMLEKYRGILSDSAYADMERSLDNLTRLGIYEDKELAARNKELNKTNLLNEINAFYNNTKSASEDSLNSYLDNLTEAYVNGYITKEEYQLHRQKYEDLKNAKKSNSGLPKIKAGHSLL